MHLLFCRMKFFAQLLFLVVGTTSFGQDRQIVISVDDLPCTNCGSSENAVLVNEKLLSHFQEFNVPAIGFVNEGKMFKNEEIDSLQHNILVSWLEAGLELGNHTYSHMDINGSKHIDYAKDISKGHRISKRLSKMHERPFRYFRAPYLHTGETKQQNLSLMGFLDKMALEMAPVTIDNDEYIYAYAYHKAAEKGDSASMRIIAYDYIDYMKKVIRHYEQLSRDFIGREIPQILLIHDNELNADYLPFILDFLKHKRYTFVDMETALKDTVYQREAALTSHGYSWLIRWEKAAGLPGTWGPEISDQMEVLWRRLNSRKPFESRQKFEGPKEEIEQIIEASIAFSRNTVLGKTEKVSNAYTEDGMIMPNRSNIIYGRADIHQRWLPREGYSTIKHVSTPIELTVLGDTAHDIGFYEGTTLNPDGSLSRWAGKYVIIWKKVDGQWLIYADIWNSL